MKERQSAKGTGTPINTTSTKNKAKASTPDKFKSKPQTIKIDANLAEQLQQQSQSHLMKPLIDQYLSHQQTRSHSQLAVTQNQKPQIKKQSMISHSIAHNAQKPQD